MSAAAAACQPACQPPANCQSAAACQSVSCQSASAAAPEPHKYFLAFPENCFIDVPLATPANEVDPALALALEALGVPTVDLVHEVHGQEMHYTVVVSHAVQANDAIRASHLPGGLSLAGQKCRVHLVPEILVPDWQTKLFGHQNTIYGVLGVSVLTVHMYGANYTIPTTCVSPAISAISAAFVASKAAGTPMPVVGPVQHVPITGLFLQDFYVGGPPHLVQVLAELFGARFLRVLGNSGQVYWVLAGQSFTLANVARLGLAA